MRSVVRSPKLPKGFFFKIRKEYDDWDDDGDYTMEVRLYDKSFHEGRYEIGGVTLQKRGKNKRGVQMWETHSNLNSSHWNKKLGVSMYVRAIKWCLDRGYKVQSSTSTSELAQRVWNGKTIRKYVRIIKRKHKYYGGHDTSWHAFAKQGTR